MSEGLTKSRVQRYVAKLTTGREVFANIQKDHFEITIISNCMYHSD